MSQEPTYDKETCKKHGDRFSEKCYSCQFEEGHSQGCKYYIAKDWTQPTKESWEIGFRRLLKDLDDKTFQDLREPIKGDIYFDGIEVEKFISTLLSSELKKQREEIRKDLEQISINYGESSIPLKKYAIEYILKYVASLQDPINSNQ